MSQELTITVQWSSVDELPGVPYLFPRPLGPYFCKHYGTAAIYRWRVVPSTSGQPEKVYIGEASDLCMRVQRVLTPSKSGKQSDTNFRLHQLFEQASAEGSPVLLETVSFDEFAINGVLFSQSTISNEFVRCAIESVLVRLTEQDKEGPKLLNKSLRNRRSQKMLQELQALPPSEAISRLQEVLSKHPYILGREPQKERAKD